ncbi:MAG: hypothetical protein Ct9H300mP11_22880 [Chloroflexota bacterium]|nr:MAG: hypothetical protein Ct9H300mP11_22880 [Chloroflexota bacterium]
MDAAIDKEVFGMDDAKHGAQARSSDFLPGGAAQAWGEVILEEFGGLVSDALNGGKPAIEGGTKWPPEN